MFIFDILIYVLFAMVMNSLAQKSYRTNPESGKWDKYLKWYVTFFTFISAIRWGVGVDSISYARSFVQGVSGHELHGVIDEKEILNTLLVHGVHDLGLHFSVGLGIYAFAQIIFIVLALKQHKYLLAVVPIVMFGSHYYLDFMNGIRQMIVASGFLWASKFIVEKKPLHYFGFIAVAYFMHNSAVMLIPLYFIPTRIGMADRRLINLAILFACFFIGNTPQFQQFAGYAGQFATLVGYDSYTDYVDKFLTTGYDEEIKSFGPTQLSYLLIGFFTIWYGPRLKKKYEEKIPSFNMWFLFSTIFICAYFLLCNTSHIFTRPLDYFSIFHMIITSLLLYDFKINMTYSQTSYIIKNVFLVIIWTTIVWNIIKVDTGTIDKDEDRVTYKVFFMHMDEVRKIY